MDQLNEIRDVKGFDTRFSDSLCIEDNPIEEIFNLFPKESWWEVVQLLMNSSLLSCASVLIRDGKIIILQAFELVYDDLGLEVPESIYEKEFENYEVR